MTYLRDAKRADSKKGVRRKGRMEEVVMAGGRQPGGNASRWKPVCAAAFLPVTHPKRPVM